MPERHTIDAADAADAPSAAHPLDPFDSPPEFDTDRPPRDPDQLHAFIARELGLVFPRAARVEGHAPAFAYLCWAFFEGRLGLAQHEAERQAGCLAAPPAPAPLPTPAAPPDAVVWACRGGGKTLAGAVATALDLIFKPGIEVRILAGSLEQAQRMNAHLRALFERPRLAPLVRGRITQRALALVNGSRAEVLAQSQTSVRGVRVQKLRCDEVELFDPAVWEAAQLTTRSRRLGPFSVRGSIECLSTMHEPHGLMAKVAAQAGAGSRALFKWGVVDVLARCEGWRECVAGEGAPPAPAPGALVALPILTAPGPAPADPSKSCPLLPECARRAKADIGGHVEVADAITMKARVGRPEWDAEMLCLRPRRTDSIFPEFDRAVHVVDRLPWDAGAEGPRARSLAAMDFGYRAPTVILWAGLDGAGRLWIEDERSVAECLIRDHIATLADAARPQPAWVAIDPAGRAVNDQTGRSNASLLREAGYDARAAVATVAAGIALVRARLRPALAEASPRLFIHRRCATLIDALERHRYRPGPDSREPLKDGTDHAADALRYLVVTLDAPARTDVTRYA